MAQPAFSTALLSPRHWPAWLLIGLWWLLAQLPWRVQMALARAASPLLRLNTKRVNMACTNLALCFPEWSEQRREQLLKDNLQATAMALLETGIAWFWSGRRLRGLYTVKGLEHLEAARESGQGALLLSMHLTTLDLGSAMLGQHVDYDGMYTPHRNPVFDYLLRTRRQAYSPAGATIPRDSVRTMIQRLRQGRMIWYAPDRDMGPKGSVFVPFFGVPAATITATAKFAKSGRARVIPFTQYRHKRGYELTIHPPFEDFPSGDDNDDARRVNAFMESVIAEHPEQYFWAQPRFRTRPDGAPSPYRRRAG